MLVILAGTHLIAMEYIPGQRSRGEVLLYQRKSRNRKAIGSDEESGPRAEDLPPTSSQDMAIVEVDLDTAQKSSTEKHLQDVAPVFHWSKLHYSIQIKQQERQILQNVEGWVRPGSLTALMVSFQMSWLTKPLIPVYREQLALGKPVFSIAWHIAPW
jgi:ATP-binding cassette, subfamily G (WHITE), member 2, PDR